MNITIRRAEPSNYEAMQRISPIRLYGNFGFVTEGTLRQFAFRDGEHVDGFTMARLREQAHALEGDRHLRRDIRIA